MSKGKKMAKAKTKKRTRTNSPLTPLQFAERYNDAVDGKAVFDKISDGSKLKPKMVFNLGDTVPATRRAMAAMMGLSYNAFIAREKSAIKKGINLKFLAKGKRGKATNVEYINTQLAMREAVTD
jgi:hypothetical protein